MLSAGLRRMPNCGDGLFISRVEQALRNRHADSESAIKSSIGLIFPFDFSGFS